MEHGAWCFGVLGMLGSDLIMRGQIGFDDENEKKIRNCHIMIHTTCSCLVSIGGRSNTLSVSCPSLGPLTLESGERVCIKRG